MSDTVVGAIIGAVIALVGVVLEHFLSLRVEKKKLEWAAEVAKRAVFVDGASDAVQKTSLRRIQELAVGQDGKLMVTGSQQGGLWRHTEQEPAQEKTESGQEGDEPD